MLRVIAGLTQCELGEKIGTYGVRIHRIETGKTEPKADELKKLKEILLYGEMQLGIQLRGSRLSEPNEAENEAARITMESLKRGKTSQAT